MINNIWQCTKKTEIILQHYLSETSGLGFDKEQPRLQNPIA